MPLPLLGFDPYEVWLGIKTTDRPLNPYELLNLVLLDADRGRVRAALDRRLTTLEGKRGGADPEIWQTVSDELEAAAAALLDPDRRAVIDASIKRKLARSGSSRQADRPPAAAAAGAPAPLTCSACQRENPPSSRYCGDCGQGLWEACPQCGGEMPALERFCGRCGTDVHGTLLAQTRQIEERLRTAEQLASAHCYDAALSALRAVAALDDPKMEKWIGQALARIDKVESQRRQALAEAGAAKKEAARFVEQAAFEWAIKVLENVPLPLRDEEARRLLAQAQFSSQEVATLLAAIKEAVQQKRFGGLFAKIDRLLTLKPDQPPILDLADKMQKQFIAAARKRLTEHRYDDALQVLDQIPPAFRRDEAQMLLEQTSELAALLAAVKQSPYATPQALALAQRLVKQAPGNDEAVSLWQQLKQQCAARPTDRRLAMAPWAAAPKSADARPPIQWLGHFVRTEAANEPIGLTLREHPGEFFIALGLALQGLDQATLTTNLVPADRGGMLGKLASLPLLTRGVTSAWGIDVGEHALKAIKLAKNASGKMKVEACHYIPLKRPLAQPAAARNEPEILSDALSELASRADFKAAKVAASLSGQRVLGRFFDLPPLPAKKVPSAIEYEARHQFPIELAELRWDWKALGANADQPADQGPRSILLLAARRSHVEERLSQMQAAGIRLDIIQCDCVALHNALRWEFSGREPLSGTLAAIEIGAGHTNFVVSAPHSLWFRSFGLGGESITSSLTERFQVTQELAEQLKRHPERAPRYSELCEAIEPQLVQLADEIDRSLASYRMHVGAEAVKRLFVLGGGAHLHGLLRKLRR